jgi:hypothetical protein
MPGGRSGRLQTEMVVSLQLMSSFMGSPNLDLYTDSQIRVPDLLLIE